MKSALPGRVGASGLWSRGVVLTVLAGSGVLILDALAPWGLAVWILQVVLMWLATLWANRQQILLIAGVSAMLIVMGFWLSPKTEPITWVDLSNLFLGVGTISALAHGCLRRLTLENVRRETALELGQLFRIVSGFLPVCAWCKKIRDEAGAWQPWEVYLRNHSSVEITHGICQACAARLDQGAEEDTYPSDDVKGR